MEPRLRASPEQFSVLIDFMERYRDLSRPQSGPQGRIKSDKLWQNVTLILNSLGGGVQRSSDKWKKVWSDWKTKTKKKYLNLRLQACGTGGGPSSRVRLTALEERVVAVIGVTAVVGLDSIQEQGFNTGCANEPLEHTQYVHDMMLEDHNIQNSAIPTPASPAIQNIDLLAQTQEFQNTATLAQQPTLPPQSPSPPPPPPPLSVIHTPPSRNNRRQPLVSSPSTSTTTRQAILRARRNRGLTPFERAAELFTNVENKRLMHEEARDKRLHEREMERIAVTRDQNLLLHQLSLLGQQLIDVISKQRPGSLPSTDPI